jgi:hypothetical protein
VSKGVARSMGAKKFALLGLVWVQARKSSPSTPYNAVFGPFFVRWANFFAELPQTAVRWASAFAETPVDGPCWASFFVETPQTASRWAACARSCPSVQALAIPGGTGDVST